MAIAPSKPSAPSSDRRWKLVDSAMRRNGYSSHALIETLHQVQGAFGYLDVTAMNYVAQSLNVPPSKVYGVATFYHLFTLKPPGRHSCVVCTGTACYIKGAQALLQAIGERFGASEGQTTPDGALSLLGARCLGACGLAPAVVLDGDVLGNQTAEQLLRRLAEAIDHAP
jgi:bidirectional [NiFe] hydrogenase diaphorase subunit